MSTYPEMSLQDRAEQPYVGMTASVTMDDFSPVVDRLPEIFGRLAERAVLPAGPPVSYTHLTLPTTPYV